MKRALVSRADLVRCLAAGEDCLAVAAELLGFRRVEAPPPKPPGVPLVEPEGIEPAGGEMPAAAVGLPDEPFWQPVGFERRAAQLASRVALPAAPALNLADPMEGIRPPRRPADPCDCR
jgi:hypothetical protein